MNVYVTDEQSVAVDVAGLRLLAESVLTDEGFPEDSEVTLMLVSDEAISEYNHRFMDRQGPTDVLAFPLEQLEPGQAPKRRPGAPPVMLGDIIIAPAYVSRQALEQGSEFTDEVSLMVVHGMLHLMGWDHADDAQAEEMEARERTLLAKVGVKRP
ncbi:MAG: rRNA maturation RNase YbeY [Acidimicrobiia bacterium]